jgi:cytoskeletal protein RodZ
MKRCPQCSFLYLDSDQLCDLDQTPLVSDPFGTDVGAIEHSEPKAVNLSLIAARHQRMLRLKTLSGAIVAGLIVGLMLLFSYQRMRPTLQASQAPQASQAQASQTQASHASRVSQIAQQVSKEASAALAQQESEVPVAPNDNTSASAKQSSSATAKTTPDTRPDSARLRVSSNPVSTGDVAKSGRGPVTIRLADGSTLQADEVWRTKAGIWYRRKGIVTFIKPNRVRSVNH